MVDFPESMTAIINAEADRYPSDIERAVKQALTKVKKLTEYQSLINDLVAWAVRDLIHQRRHVVNRAMRKASGMYGSPEDMTAAGHEIVREVFDNLYDYPIGGTALGELTGEDLLAEAESLKAKMSGIQWNVSLCEALIPIVPASKKVKQAVSLKKLKVIWNDLSG